MELDGTDITAILTKKAYSHDCDYCLFHKTFNFYEEADDASTLKLYILYVTLTNNKRVYFKGYAQPSLLSEQIVSSFVRKLLLLKQKKRFSS